MGFLERIAPYSKHNIYTTPYTIENGKIVVPQSAGWMAMAYRGFDGCAGMFEVGRGDIIALILNDEENQFFAVISFLTRDEAIELAKNLLEVAGDLGGGYDVR